MDNKRGLPGAARDYVTISKLWNKPVQIDLRTQRALGWGELPTNKFLFTNPPRGANFFVGPSQFSKHTPPFGRVDPTGPRFWWAPRKYNFTIQTHPEEQILFAGPRPILYSSGFFRWGHYRGYPGDQHLGSPPGSVPSPGEMRSPCQISGW